MTDESNYPTHTWESVTGKTGPERARIEITCQCGAVCGGRTFATAAAYFDTHVQEAATNERLRREKAAAWEARTVGANAAKNPPRKLSKIPVCDTCDDTHRMTLGEREVMCTHCPTPCQRCRADGTGAYCQHPRCPCTCHKRDAVVVPAMATPEEVSEEDCPHEAWESLGGGGRRCADCKLYLPPLDPVTDGQAQTRRAIAVSERLGLVPPGTAPSLVIALATIADLVRAVLVDDHPNKDYLVDQLREIVK